MFDIQYNKSTTFISNRSLLLQTLYRSVRPDIYPSRAEYHLSAPYFVFLHINTLLLFVYYIISKKAAQISYQISERLFIILLLIFFFFISPGRRGILHGCNLTFFDAFCALRHK